MAYDDAGRQLFSFWRRGAGGKWVARRRESRWRRRGENNLRVFLDSILPVGYNCFSWRRNRSSKGDGWGQRTWP
jgi:hypothetical protein